MPGPVAPDARTDTIFSPVRQAKTTVSVGVRNEDYRAPAGFDTEPITVAVRIRATVLVCLQSGLPLHESARTLPSS